MQGSLERKGNICFPCCILMNYCPLHRSKGSKGCFCLCPYLEGAPICPMQMQGGRSSFNRCSQITTSSKDATGQVTNVKMLLVGVVGLKCLSHNYAPLCLSSLLACFCRFWLVSNVLITCLFTQ
jgi:hypothetical protein